MRKKLKAKTNVEQKTGAVIGYIAYVNGARIPVSKYNQIAKRTGLKCLKKYNLEDDVDEINKCSKDPNITSGPTMYGAYRDVVNSKHPRQRLYDYVGSEQSPYNFKEQINNAFQSTVINNQFIKDFNTKFRKHRRWNTRRDIYIFSILRNMAKNIKKYSQTPTFKPRWKKHTDKTMIITASDLHIGATVDVHSVNASNHYNIHIALERWHAYINRCLEIAKEFHIHDIKFICCGDLNESYYMRTTERDEAEVGLAEQIPIVEDLLVKTIKVLSRYYPVDVYMITGNHDRVNGNKFDNKYGDTYTLMEMHFLKAMQDEKVFAKDVTIHTKNANADQIHDLYLNIRGKHYFFIHGDTRIKQSKPGNITPLQTNGRIDVLIYGHYHNYHCFSDDDGRMEYCLGSLEGWNTYSKSLRTNCASANQTAFIAKQNHMPIAIPIDLGYIQK